jgi:hypothetical protein
MSGIGDADMLFVVGAFQTLQCSVGADQGQRRPAPFFSNIHFCGEHTAVSNRGMEGAMESGEHAAMEILALA